MPGSMARAGGMCGMAPDFASELCERTSCGGSNPGTDLDDFFRVREGGVVTWG